MRPRKENGHNIVRYNQIDKNIWIGTNQCCQTHFEKKLLDKGITADVSLEEKRVDAPFGVESYLWLPTVDHTPPTIDQMELGAEHINHLIANKHKIYVHCQNGHGRAPTLVAAYYIFKGMTVGGAIRKVERKRQGAHINELQKEGLEAFKKRMKKH